MEISKDMDCDTIAVWSDPNAIGFYRKCSINDITYCVNHIEIDLSDANIVDPKDLDIREFPEHYDAIKNWIFVSPRIGSSFTTWVKRR